MQLSQVACVPLLMRMANHATVNYHNKLHVLARKKDESCNRHLGGLHAFDHEAGEDGHDHFVFDFRDVLR